MLPNTTDTNTLYQLALTFVKDVGPKTARNLLSHFGTAEAIFNASVKDLTKVAGLGPVRAKAFKESEALKRAEQELTYIQKESIKPLWIGDEGYPTRLKRCNDAPLLLYTKGDVSLNFDKSIAIVGTRKYTDYGQRICEHLVEDLRTVAGVAVISGLAAGIDTIAHKAAVSNNIATVGVLGHGHDRIYPASNKNLAKEMLGQGGVLTEFPSGTIPDKTNFPMRNRIVAGMSDVTVVVESDIKGGAMITARVASSYNRDVVAYPGRIFDSRSSGCNELIRTNVAAMITKTEDLLELMNWDTPHQVAAQTQLFLDLSPEQQKLIDILQEKDSVHTDQLLDASGMTSSQMAGVLLQLELQGLVKALPGKFYRLD